MFRVGQKVVCVDAGPDKYGKPAKLKGGAIYTVRAVDGYGGVYLHETKCNYGDGFYERRFRPVVERKTDISIFKKMLTPNTRNVERV